MRASFSCFSATVYPHVLDTIGDNQTDHKYADTQQVDKDLKDSVLAQTSSNPFVANSAGLVAPVMAYNYIRTVRIFARGIFAKTRDATVRASSSPFQEASEEPPGKQASAAGD